MPRRCRTARPAQTSNDTSRDGQVLSVHRLVQAVTRQQLNSEQDRQWATSALDLLHLAFPKPPQRSRRLARLRTVVAALEHRA